MTAKATTPKIRAWARVWAAVKPEYSKTLRMGAWYPVVHDKEPDRVTLHFRDRDYVVPRRVLEIRPRRPKHFSVILRIGYEPDPSRKSRFGLGKRYGVCPQCSSRFALFGKPTLRTCKRCGHEGEVGWWET